MPDIWFVAASAHLYDADMQAAASRSKQAVEILSPAVAGLNLLPGPLITTPDALRSYLTRAEKSSSCAAVITWMHSSETVREWSGIAAGRSKPICILHESASTPVPAGRGRRATVVVGSVHAEATRTAIKKWSTAVKGHTEFTRCAVARAAEQPVTQDSEDGQVALVEEYRKIYSISNSDPALNEVLFTAARYESMVSRMLGDEAARAFTSGAGAPNTLAIQRLMQEGYGYAPGGDDWTARFVRTAKVMVEGSGAASFMDTAAFGSTGVTTVEQIRPHTLTVCPSLHEGKTISVDIPHHAGRWGTPRIVVDMPWRRSLVVSLSQPDRKRLIAIAARARLDPQRGTVETEPFPSRDTANACWAETGSPQRGAIIVGLDLRVLEIWCEIAGLELLPVEEHTTLKSFTRSAHR